MKLVIRRSTPVTSPAVPLVGSVECDGFPFKAVDGWVSLDTETTGLDPWGTFKVDRPRWPARPWAFSLGNADGETAYVRWQVDPFTRRVVPDPRTFDLLQEIVGDAAIAKVYHNAPYDRRMLKMSGFEIKGETHDTQIGAHTINPTEFDYKLKPLCKRYLQISDEDEKELHKATVVARRGAKKSGWMLDEAVAADYWLADPAAARKYARLDAYRTAALWLAVVDALDGDETGNGWKVYRHEQKLLPAIEAMENRGLRVDVPRIKDVLAYYDDFAARANKDIVDEMGDEFNTNSPKQMTAEFFGQRGYAPKMYSFDKGKDSFTKCQHCKGTGCGVCQLSGRNPKCDGDFLESIAVEHQTDETGQDVVVCKDTLAYAILHKSAADTMLSYVRQYDDFKVQESPGVWVIHPNIKQTGTKTGRCSAEKPNMQNVASDESGKKRVNISYRPRECFIPRDGFVFYIPDYSQIEVWVLFLRAKAIEPINMLAKGGDAHGIVSRMIWGHLYDFVQASADKSADPKSLTPERQKNLKTFNQCRKRAKNLQFCKIYGGGTAKIASMIGCSVDQAKVFIDDYDKRLPEVKSFMYTTVTLAKRQGHIYNAYGRKYPIDRKFAYRATNYDIQGSAADLIKAAMIYAHDLCSSGRYLSKLFMLLTIHDELIFEVHKSIDDVTTQRAIAEVMGRDHKKLGCPIPFPIGMKIAPERWSESREVKV